jgi:hypothetical protein
MKNVLHILGESGGVSDMKDTSRKGRLIKFKICVF